jgi:hypothetical protein
MNAAMERQQLAALKLTEKRDGTIFALEGVSGVGILGVPSVETQLSHSGPAEKISATLTVRRVWFTNAPVSGSMQELTIHAASGLQVATAVLTGSVPSALIAAAPVRRYLVTGVNTDDPLAYEFTLMDRN